MILSDEQVARFMEDGFLVVDNFFDPEECANVKDHIHDVFHYKYETGVAPDLNDGMSKDSYGLSNAWRSDYALANMVLGRKIGQALCQLLVEQGEEGVRILRDVTVWKQPGSDFILYHQDDAYTSAYDRAPITNCFISLSDASDDVGWLEYIPGSHRWGLLPPPAGVYGAKAEKKNIGEFAYRQPAIDAAKIAGVELTEDDFKCINTPSGTVIFHHPTVWHGSAANKSETESRTITAIQATRSDAKYAENPGYDIDSVSARRYKRPGSLEIDEAFFPVLWTKDGYRTPWLDDFLAGNPQ